jgi:putative DNA base modification enzyme with NMAD domain
VALQGPRWETQRGLNASPMAKAFIYVVDRDFGFAPNPFHGFCTLATCKRLIRRSAATGDWVIGMGGGRLRATGRCIYAMRVDGKLSFDAYWQAAAFRDKIPVRNGSARMLVGDNIYHREVGTGAWIQVDSHHSNSDGTANVHNLNQDTGVDAVLVSEHFYYFGRHAPIVPPQLLTALGYKNRRGYRVFDLEAGFSDVICWLEREFRQELNRVSADPFDFHDCTSRYSVRTNRLYRVQG